MEIQELIRHWQAGGSQPQIGIGTGLSSVTVRKYLAAALEAGMEKYGSAPDEVQLSRLAGVSMAGPEGWRLLWKMAWCPGGTRFTSGSAKTGCS